MFFKLEFNKIFKRSFNYLYGLLVLILSLILTYKVDYLSNYFQLSKENILFDIIFKIILILVIFIAGINYIYSYREDYTSKVIKLLKFKKLENRKIFMAVIVNSLYFFFYSLIIMGIVISLVFFTNKVMFDNIYSTIIVDMRVFSYISLLFVLILFANLIFLLMLSLFNSTNLAISLSLLYFIGSQPLAELLKRKFSIFQKYIDISLNIFNNSFDKFNQFTSFSNIGLWLNLGINVFLLIVIIYILRFIKK